MNKKLGDKPGLGEILVYSSGELGMNLAYTLFSSFVLFFYTDTLGLNAATVGLVILFSKIFDGFSDLIAGNLIDKTHTKDGHCIPWMRRFAIPYGVSLVLVFLMPANATPVIQVIFLFVTYNLFNTVFYTVETIAQATLPLFTTEDQGSRSTMRIYDMVFSCITQLIIANVTLPMVAALGNDQAAWVKMTAIFAVIAIVIIYIESFVVKERVSDKEEGAKEEKVPFLKALGAAFKNKYWLISLGLITTGVTHLMFSTQVSIYYLRSVLGNAGLVGLFILIMNLPGIPIGFILPKFVEKFGKRDMCVFGTILQFVGQIILIVAPSASITWLWVSTFIRGCGFGIVYPLGAAMLMDTVEYGEWKTGVRTQGVLVSANSVAMKVVSGLITSLLGFILAAIGYDGLAEVQTAAAVAGIDSFFKWAPMVVYALQLVLLLFYHLDKEYPQIAADLAARHAQAVEE